MDQKEVMEDDVLRTQWKSPGTPLTLDQLYALYSSLRTSMELSGSDVAEIELCFQSAFTSGTNTLQSGFGTMVRLIWPLNVSSTKSRKTLTSRCRMIEAMYAHAHPGKRVRWNSSSPGGVTATFYW